MRAVLLSASGMAFSVGQDLKEMDHDYQLGHETLGSLVEREYVPLVKVLQNMPKPTVALVQGVAVGGGMSLALATDFRVLSPEARFIAGFVKVGLAPDTGTSYLLPRMIGHAQALRILLTGDAIGAEEAVHLGLSDAVQATREDADAKAHELSGKLALGPTQAYAEIRRLVSQSSEIPFDLALSNEVAAQDRLSHTEDHRTAISAFLAKSPVHFQGR